MCYNNKDFLYIEAILLELIDFHCHIYPDAVADKAAQSIRDFYEIGGGNLAGTVDNLLTYGKSAGISRYVVLPVSLKPERTLHINDFIVSQVAQHPEFTGFGTIHAAMDSIMDETQRIMDLGLKGIKMHPDSQVFAIDDPRLLPVYEQIQGKLTVMLHMGDHRYDYSHPVRLRRVLELFPRLDVVAAHFGGYSMYKTAYELLNDKNCVFDVSSSLMFMPDGEAEKYIRAYGAERMLFGTDFPLWNPVEETQRFLQLKLTDGEFEQIGSKTALRVLGEI